LLTGKRLWQSSGTGTAAVLGGLAHGKKDILHSSKQTSYDWLGPKIDSSQRLMTLTRFAQGYEQG
jgi:hypothetical protein